MDPHFRRFLPLWYVALAAACSGSSADSLPELPTSPPPVEPPTPFQRPLYLPPLPETAPPEPPASDSLTAVVSLGFGDAPLEGVLWLLPGAEGGGALYSVDLDGDRVPDHRGTLDGARSIPYRFEAAGVHPIRVAFRAAGGDRSIELAVVVNDPSRIHLTHRTAIATAPGAERSFEGIVIEHSGARLYVANYRGGVLAQLDAGTLSEIARIDTIPYSIEGLSISPSDRVLFGVYKYRKVSRVGLSEMEIREIQPGGASFFIHALDDHRALVSGRSVFGLYDAELGRTVAEAWSLDGKPLYAGHFAMSPAGDVAAVVGRQSGRLNVIHLVQISSMATVGEIELQELGQASVVAFDPHEARLYVLGNEVRSTSTGRVLAGARFLVVDLTTGATVVDLPIGSSSCSPYCVANPIATSRSGRYVAMEWGGGTYLVDTRLDLPVTRIGLFRLNGFGFSAAASPVEEVFFFLNDAGDVFRVFLP